MSLYPTFDSNLRIKIENFIDQICSLQTITPQMKMDVYREIYNYFCGRPSESATNYDNREEISRHLYNHIEIYLQNKFKEISQRINDTHDEDKLRLYNKYWNKYKNMSRNLNYGCKLIREYQDQNNSPITIDILSEQTWEKFFFAPLLSSNAETCLNLIKTCRNEKSSIDFQLIKETIEMYMDENFNSKIGTLINTDQTSNIYKQYIEIGLIRDAKDFYRQQNMTILELNSITEYLTEITKKFDEIIDFHGSYLPRDTLKILLTQSEDMLIPDYKLKLVVDELKILVQNENYEELGNLYKTISRIFKIKAELIKLIKPHANQKGRQQLEDIRPAVSNNFEIYVQTVYKIYMTYSTIINEYFHNDSQFLTALNRVCQCLVNEYSIIGINGNTIKSFEILARYCDTLLRNGDTMQNIDFEDKVKQIMCVFDYIEDKDIFMKLFEKMSTKRFIDQINISDDNEAFMILKLKEVCGVEYTSKLQQMFQDQSLSKTLTERYKTHNPTDTIDLSVTVFSANVWPFSKPSCVILPPELQLTFTNFTNLYNQQHTGRRLILLHQYSKGELQTFTDRRYKLQVSMYQMIVLLLFNQSSNWTVQQIEDRTEIQGQLLLQTIYSLLNSRLLTCTRLNGDFTETDINSNDSIQLSDNYTNNKIKIRLDNLMKSTKRKDQDKLHRNIDADRRMIIQATIVRIMKGRGQLPHSLLMDEVIDQLKSRFKPDVPLIKKCIEILIETAYLQRSLNEKDVLEYLA